MGVRQRWRVGLDCNSNVCSDLAGSNPATPTKQQPLNQTLMCVIEQHHRWIHQMHDFHPETRSDGYI